MSAACLPQPPCPPVIGLIVLTPRSFAGCCIWLVVAAYIWRAPAPLTATFPPASATKGNGSSSSTSPASVTVVMPVKGMHAHSQTNWTAHVQSTYPGNIQFVFVVEVRQPRAAYLLLAVTCCFIRMNATVRTRHCAR